MVLEMQVINQVMKSMNSGSNFQIEILKQYCCMKCREEVKEARLVIALGPEKGQTVVTKNGCYCKSLEEMETSRRKARVENLQATFDRNSLINPDLRKATFDSFIQDEFTDAFNKAKNFVEEFDINTPCNLLFQGSFGTGKSHLSVAITKILLDKGFSTVFISTPKLLTNIRGTYNKFSNQSEKQIISAIVSADLVVFDDIGAEGIESGWAVQKLFEVIDQRLGKHNIYTTNLSSREFEASKDLQRIFSRMIMNTTPIIMNGTDYRKKNFKV